MSRILCQNCDTEMYLDFLTAAENYRFFFSNSLPYLRFYLFCTAFCYWYRFTLAWKF